MYTYLEYCAERTLRMCIFKRKFQKREIVHSFFVLLNTYTISRRIALNGSITFSYRMMFTCNRSITESLVSRAVRCS